MKYKLSSISFFNAMVLTSTLFLMQILQLNGLRTENQENSLESRAEESMAISSQHNILSLLGSKRSGGLLAENQAAAGCFPMRGGGNSGGGGGGGGGTGGGGTGGGGGALPIPGAGDAANTIEEAAGRRIQRMRMAARKRRQQNARKRFNKLIQDVKLKLNNKMSEVNV